MIKEGGKMNQKNDDFQSLISYIKKADDESLVNLPYYLIKQLATEDVRAHYEELIQEI